MVRVKENTHVLDDGSINVEDWLHQLGNKGYLNALPAIQNACTLSQVSGLEHATESGQSCFSQGLAMADILADLEVDSDTLIAAIVYETVQYADLSLDDVEEQLGDSIAKLVRGIEKMNALSNLKSLEKFHQNKHQVDNLRKMLIAMVDDVRVVLIKLAERLCLLRSAGNFPEKLREQIANETMEIYAPLANRLGIGAVKWELEDLAFRYLNPPKYKEIAKGLKSKRIERDKFVNRIVDELNKSIAALGFQHFAVYGRSKHIHSIYKKMVRKNVPLAEIYDATAVRILVEEEKECYETLSLVHSLWKQVIAEFDDYINNPKPNGYQSLHTAVQTEEGRVFEVQIRTFQMHDFAELGVAAHWKYKEGGAKTKESHERKIEWLREVLAWQREMATQQGVSESLEKEFLEDRVYVFTPDGEVLDLPNGATPLDFAYHVHSQVGHKCRGTKVNGKIVPITYTLKTGDKVEVLTGKEAKPSRDWLNPHLGYLKTSRARAKVLHWFKMQDFDKNKREGYEMLEKELKALGLSNEKLVEVIDRLNFKTQDDMMAAIGRGDLKLGQVVNRLSTTESPVKKAPALKTTMPNEPKSSDLKIEGVGSLLTHMAKCCQPVPGEDVIGYITQGRGVSIHRKDCPNILHSSDKQKQRFMEVSWGEAQKNRYLVDLVIKAFDRPGLLRDITSLFANEKVNLYSLDTKTKVDENLTYINCTVETDGLTGLSRLLTKINQVSNVLDARRQAT